MPGYSTELKVCTKIRLLASFLIFLCLPEKTFPEKSVLILNDTNDAPYTTADQKGFVDIIMGEVFRRAGLELKLIKLPAERALLNADLGIIDGDLSRIAGLDKNYKNLIQIPEVLFMWEFVAFSKISVNPPDVNHLTKQSIGHLKGWKIYERMFEKASNVITVDTPEQLFLLLKKDRIEVALFERWMGAVQIKKMEIHSAHPLLPPLAKREMFVYLNKKHEKIVPRLVEELRALKRNGFYDKVYLQKLKPYREGNAL
jgi:polar amino acid transport system substrate-binding protein